MKKSMVIALAIAAALVATGCASGPYVKMQLNPEAPITGKAIYLDVAMQQRALPILPIVDAGIYNIAVKGAEASLAETQEKSVERIDAAMSAAFAETLGVEIQRVDNPFAGESFMLTVLNKADAATKARIAELCAEYSADYAICGGGLVTTTGVSAFGINGFSKLTLEYSVFDASGNAVAIGAAHSPIVTGQAKDTTAFSMVFEQGRVAGETLVTKFKK